MRIVLSRMLLSLAMLFLVFPSPALADPDQLSVSSTVSSTEASVQNPSWLMKGHDVFRTGKSPVLGPMNPPKGIQSWTYTANDAHIINMEASVSRDGVYFGGWGLIRRQGNSKTNWDKLDGRFYGLSLKGGECLWKPFHPELVPYAYSYAGRPSGIQDKAAGHGFHLNYFNGTIEGTAAIDEESAHLYFGRGDGVLYAIDGKTGREIWKFRTMDPLRPDDPEGGGEIIGGPLLIGNRILFATFAAPTSPNPPNLLRCETNAVYCIDKSGQMLWRYPKVGGLDNPFCAPLALSRDGKRVYAITQFADIRKNCEFLCFKLESGELQWKLDLPDSGGFDIAVASDGKIFIAGMQRTKFAIGAAAFAYADFPQGPRLLWKKDLTDLRHRNHFAGGLALDEKPDGTEVLLSTSNIRGPFGGPNGRLFALSPENGETIAIFEPEKAETPGIGAMTDISIGANSVVYVGTHGGGHGARRVPARMYALKRNSNKSFNIIWSFQLEDELDWASPAIGPDSGLYFGSSSRMGVLQEILPHPKEADVPHADPKFYGIHDLAQ